VGRGRVSTQPIFIHLQDTDMSYRFKSTKDWSQGTKECIVKHFQSQEWPGWSLSQSLLWKKSWSCYLGSGRCFILRRLYCSGEGGLVLVLFVCLFVFSTGVWIQGLHFEPATSPFLWCVFSR
jgi:hypothetical protein